MFHSVKTKIIASFLGAVVAIVAIGSFACFQYLHWYEHGLTDQMGQTASESCATLIGLMAQDEDAFVPGSANYEENRNLLRSFCATSDMKYAYAFHRNPKTNKIEYIICVAADDKEDEIVARERPYGTELTVETSEQELRALRGEPPTEALLVENQFDSMLAWFSKVEGMGDDVLASVDYSVSDQRIRVFRATATILVPFVLAILVLMIIQLKTLRKRIFKPIGLISNRMKTFSTERADAFEPIGITSQDEMGEIAEAFEDMVANINSYLGDIERMTTERVQTEAELDVARRIQQGLVPEHMELSGTGFDACALARSARSVGGDFYDIFALDDNRVAGVVGDASGKGVASALFMATAKTMIRDGLHQGHGPADVLNNVNAQLCSSNPEGMFITVFACVFDPTSGEVRYANAGHMPPLVVGAEAHALDINPGVLLGLFDDVDLKEGSLQLERGQGLLLYTDGVTEAVNDNRMFFGADAFIEHMATGAPYKEAATVIEAAAHAVDGFAGECEQFDDLTVVALMRCQADAEELEPAIASFSAIRDALFALDVDDDLKRKACLACEEAYVNIVTYSQASFIRYRVWEDEGAAHIVLEDDGIPFDPTTEQSPDKGFEDLDSGGMGIGLMRQLTSYLAYQRKGNLNSLELAVRTEE